ncbi:hypothetical protein THARTR1_04571 [Trichoderma harzianum]|uniref:Uncharacterized protein n=1 Tax=Trichoderma harzianum TaxID=5544 RepID=A0A2K0UAS6_TRIHA|nr:hypothetical protein THARTR1_04571 [Trichoderma harzianum]
MGWEYAPGGEEAAAPREGLDQPPQRLVFSNNNTVWDRNELKRRHYQQPVEPLTALGLESGVWEASASQRSPLASVSV